MPKRHLAACAAAFTAVGALLPATANAGTAAADVHVRTLTRAPLSASSLLSGGGAATGRAFSRTVRSHAAGPLAPVLSFSDLGLLTVAAYPSDANSASGTATGVAYSIDFGDKSSASVTAGPIVHTYAKPGTYTITLTETDSAGDSATVSGAYTTQGSDYTAYGPTRLLDTRNGTGALQGAVAPGTTINLKVAGVGSIPANAQAVVLNLTVTAPTAAGAITDFPGASAATPTVGVDFAAGQTVSTLAVAKIGTDGTVNLLNNSAGTVQVIADATGYFTQSAAGGYTSLAPARLLDTRKGIGAPAGVVGQGKSVTLTIAGADGGQLPATGITAVALNVTVTGTVGGGYLTVYPDGSTRPLASSLNFSPGDTLANMVIVPVGSDGKVDLYNSSSGTQIIADVAGYFSGGGANAYLPVAPYRIGDTTNDGTGSIPGAATRELPLIQTTVTDPTSGVSSSDPFALGMTGFVLTTTVTNTVQGGYLTVYPFGATRPVVSNLNFGAGQTVANLALATDGLDSAQNVMAVDYYNGTSGTFDVKTDLAGVFGTY